MASEAVQRIIAEMSDLVGRDAGLDGTLKLDFGEPGSVLIDGKAVPNHVASGDGAAADCTLMLTLLTYQRLRSRELDPTSAYMQGEMRMRGDMSIAMKFGMLLQQAIRR
jgi:putative sterol carrier protein